MDDEEFLQYWKRIELILSGRMERARKKAYANKDNPKLALEFLERSKERYAFTGLVRMLGMTSMALRNQLSHSIDNEDAVLVIGDWPVTTTKKEDLN